MRKDDGVWLIVYKIQDGMLYATFLHPEAKTASLKEWDKVEFEECTWYNKIKDVKDAKNHPYIFIVQE